MLEHLHPSTVAAIAPAIGGLIQAERARSKLSAADIARRCGVARHTVIDWEDGRELPRPQQWKRLHGTLRRLPPLAALRAWIAEQMDRLSQRAGVVAGPTSPLWLVSDLMAADATTVEPAPTGPAAVAITVAVQEPVAAEATTAIPPPPPIVAAPEPAPLLSRYESFGAGLRALREHAGCEQWVIGELIGVEQSTISAWERDAVAPIYQHLLRLYDLFPELPRLAPPPPSRDIPKPRGPLALADDTNDGDDDDEHDHVVPAREPTLAELPPQPPPQPLPDAPDGLDLLVRALPICEHLWGGPFSARVVRAGGETEITVSSPGPAVTIAGRAALPRLAVAGVLGRIRSELSRRRAELDAMSAAIGGGADGGDDLATDAEPEEGSEA